ncbi:MAG: nucleotidyltransferase substrate binding protein [Tissierellales bacterium]|jgi:nucleotidyltransferase substrate binding protein (TIGR01987 family)|nr:nucleotidyltransferase substrate binding protein [Tissierellales bacterium]
MDEFKETRWRQRFQNFEKAYKLLDQYSHQPIKTELEQAGIIQFFEIAFELSWKVMKDYLEAQEFLVKSPRETIKMAHQINLIDDGYIWMDALADRNMTVHTYDNKLAEKMVKDIVGVYFPELEKLYNKLLKEL